MMSCMGRRGGGEKVLQLSVSRAGHCTLPGAQTRVSVPHWQIETQIARVAKWQTQQTQNLPRLTLMSVRVRPRAPLFYCEQGVTVGSEAINPPRVTFRRSIETETDP